MPWNRWPHARGIRGHMFMDSMATYPWNTHPIWQGMLTKTAKGATLSQPEFYSWARSILKQKSMYEPVTMAER